MKLDNKKNVDQKKRKEFKTEVHSSSEAVAAVELRFAHSSPKATARSTSNLKYKHKQQKLSKTITLTTAKAGAHINNLQQEKLKKNSKASQKALLRTGISTLVIVRGKSQYHSQFSQYQGTEQHLMESCRQILSRPNSRRGTPQLPQIY